MPKRSVLIITYYWPPAGGPGVQRWLKFARYLPEFDIEPVILTVHPDKASYQVFDNSMIREACRIRTFYTDTREPFKLFKKATGVKNLPIGGGEFESRSTFLKKISLFIRGNLFIPDPRRGWNRFAYKKAVSLIKEYNIKTVLTTSPPHSTQLIGLKLKRKFEIKWIADLRDPWTDIYYYKQFMHTPLAALIDRLYERNVLLSADKVITVSDSVSESLYNKIKEIKEPKIKIIPNGFDENDFINGSKSLSPAKPDTFTIIYTGTIGSLYGVEGFIEAVSELYFEGKKLKLMFIGTTDSYVYDLIQKSGINAITEFIPYVDHKEAIRYMCEDASALLLCIPKINKNKGILTGKLFEYLASRKPIIGIGPPDGNAAEIITECGAGIIFDYDDIQNLKKYLLGLMEKKFSVNENNNKYLKFSRKGMTELLVELI